MQRWAVALGPLIGAVALASASEAGTPLLTVTVNLADYNHLAFEMLMGALPARAYKISVNSTVPLALFEVENLVYFSGTDYFPDGTVEGADEGSEYAVAFNVNLQAMGRPYTDTEVAIVPPTQVFRTYYPDGVLASDYTDVVLGQFLSLASLDDGGQAVVTVSNIPEPSVWGLMVFGAGLSGAAIRRRRPAVS